VNPDLVVLFALFSVPGVLGAAAIFGAASLYRNGLRADDRAPTDRTLGRNERKLAVLLLALLGTLMVLSTLGFCACVGLVSYRP
jgi:hypothetical protein